MSYNKWTPQQEAFVLICRNDGDEWKTIARKMQQKFGVSRSAVSIASRMSQKRNEKPKNRTYIKWNQELIDFIHTCKNNGMSHNKISIALSEQFGINTSPNNVYNRLNSSTPSKQLKKRLEDVNAGTSKSTRKKAQKKKPKKEAIAEVVDVLDWRQDKASRKQLRFVASLVLNNPTQNQIRDFVISNENMTKGDADAIINQKRRDEVAEKPTVKTLSRKTETPSRKFSKKEDMRILTDFYELSITEAREEFGIPYYLVAKRLEELFDSEKPQHISMLKEASEIVRKRKAIANMGFFAKRRMKRNEKKVAKLKARLNKLGGE